MKHSGKTSFEDLLSRHEIITRDDQKKIVGGDIIDDMFNMIFYTGIFDLNNPDDLNTLNQLKQDFRDLASTPLGMHVLGMINNFCSRTNEKVIFLFDSNLPEGMTVYNSDQNFLKLKDNQSYGYKGYNSFWHELYHVYTDMILGIDPTNAYYHDTAGEVDANLFLLMAVKEYDYFKIPNLPAKAFTVDNDGVVNPNDANWMTWIYQTSWNDIFNNGNFTVGNYDILVSYFKWGSRYSVIANQTPQGQAYLYSLTANNITEAQMNTLNEYRIDDLFNQFYKPYMFPPDPNDPNNSGASYNGMQGPGWGTNAFWDWYNNYGPGSGATYTGGGVWERWTSETTGWDYWKNSQTGEISSTRPYDNGENGQDPNTGMTYLQYQAWNNFWNSLFNGNPAFTGQGWGCGFGASSH